MLHEKRMQEFWETGCYLPARPQTSCGIPLTIIDPGIPNRHAGPDFFNARIRMGSLQWAGNVEIHRKASDWFRHGHHRDPAYNNVILHVVSEDDRIVFNNIGIRIPSLVLQVLHGPSPVPAPFGSAKKPQNCRIAALSSNPARWQGLQSRLAMDAMEEKSRRIRAILARCEMDWERTLLLVMASAYGLPANSLPFEWSLAGIPVQIIRSQRDHLSVLEALLMGISGFLKVRKEDGPYKKELQKHFRYFRSRLHHPPLPTHLWKFLQMRPASFPTLRLAQFAALLHIRYPLLDQLLKLERLPELEQFLRSSASAYWNTHYRFGKVSPEQPKASGKLFIHTLIINGIAPYLYTYGKLKDSSQCTRRAISLWQDLPPENNHVTRYWSSMGIPAKNAFESQSLIHVNKSCFKQKYCFNCQLNTGIHRPVS